MAPVALPDTHDNLQGSPLALAAYARLLPLQSRHPVEVRISGWMMIHAPTEAGRTHVATCINNSADDTEVIAWGKWFVVYFAAYSKLATLHKHTPTPSNHPSRPDLDVLREEILASLDEAPQNHSNAKKQGGMLSGLVDSSSYEASIRLQNIPDISVGFTECSHILPQYVNHDLNNNLRLDAAASVWTVLQCFGEVQADELNGPLMHHLSNILTLQVNYHEAFDSLRLWLDPIAGTEHQYAIGKSAPAYYPELPATVTFVTADPRLPLPDRRYLALHAACAKAVNMSGAGILIDKILDDYAETRVLSEDGSSGELLARLLSVDALTAY